MSKILWAFFLTFTVGCSVAGLFFDAPKIDLQKVDFTNTTLSETTLILNFLVENPNSVDLTVNRIDYSVILNHKPFTNGILESGFTIQGKSTRTVPLSIRVRLSDVLSSLAESLRTGSTPYQVEGSVNLGYMTVPFQHSGEMKIKL